MPRKTTQQFIKEAKAVHGERYDYSQTQYRNNKTKVVVICPEHGPWDQAPSNHLSGFGCRQCGLKNAGQYHKKDTSRFIEQARKVHGDKYDYSRVEYVGAREKVEIICPVHGAFFQVANVHISGSECLKCSYQKRGKMSRLSFGEFLKRAHEVHDNFYVYDQAKRDFSTTLGKIEIQCPVHGRFRQTPGGHLSGRGCPKCRYQKSAISNRKTKEEFIADARHLHGKRYSYSKIDYRGAHEPVVIECPVDGEFLQSPTSHLSGIGCPRCSRRDQGAPRNLVRALRGEFDQPKGSYFYIVRFRLPEIGCDLYKVGSGSGSRKRTVSASIRRVGGEILDVYSCQFDTSGEAIVFEHLAHEQVAHSKFAVPPDRKFAGYSEVFSLRPDLEKLAGDPVMEKFRAGERWDPRNSSGKE